MKNCVIVLNFEDHYLSVLCHYDNNTDIGYLLRTHHDSLKHVERLLSNGDICHFDGIQPKNFRTEYGYAWSQVKPVIHKCANSLIDYCTGVGSGLMMFYENGVWGEISISPEQELEALNSDWVA